jgi:hypothetical protein
MTEDPAAYQPVRNPQDADAEWVDLDRVKAWMACPVVQSDPGGGFPHVEGRCPACGSGGLFVGAGGYVTCPHLGCTDPCAPSKALGVTF